MKSGNPKKESWLHGLQKVYKINRYSVVRCLCVSVYWSWFYCQRPGISGLFMGPRKGRALEGGEAFHNGAKFFLFLPFSNCCGSTMIVFWSSYPWSFSCHPLLVWRWTTNCRLCGVYMANRGIRRQWETRPEKTTCHVLLAIYVWHRLTLIYRNHLVLL